MNEKQVLRTFLLFLFMVVVLSLASAANAAVTVTPSVPEYRPEPSGGYFRTNGTWEPYVPASNSYNARVGSFNIGGTAMTAPAKIKLVENAEALVKTAIRLNPTKLVATLAAGWLFEQGLEYMNDHWQKKQNLGNGYGYQTCSALTGNGSVSGTESQVRAGIDDYYGHLGSPNFSLVSDEPFEVSVGYPGLQPATHYYCSGTPQAQPVADNEWDALPNPIPTVAPELPNVGYMPKGAPVDAPKYDFAPYSVPSGEPYKKPDGSTVQPMVTISSNNTNITYNTWNQTIINNLGEPVVDAPPIDENKDEAKDPCDTNPDRLGCAKLDETTAEAMPSETRDIEMISPVSVGGAGQCPAPLTASFLGQAVEFSFDPLCTYADALRPVVLVLAWLSSGLIFIGGVRN